MSIWPGASGARLVHLGQPAVELFGDAPRIDGKPWVISGSLTGKRLNDRQPVWQRIRACADGKAVRIHDLRHTVATRRSLLVRACP